MAYFLEDMHFRYDLPVEDSEEKLKKCRLALTDLLSNSEIFSNGNAPTYFIREKLEGVAQEDSGEYNVAPYGDFSSILIVKSKKEGKIVKISIEKKEITLETKKNKFFIPFSLEPEKDSSSK